MIALRLLAMFAGAAVLTLPALLVSEISRFGLPRLAVAGGLLSVAAVSASFLYVGLMGGRMRRHGAQRLLGGLLLLAPITGSLVLLANREEPIHLWISGVMLLFSVVLFLSFVFPGTGRRQRPMRRDERAERPDAVAAP